MCNLRNRSFLKEIDFTRGERVELPEQGLGERLPAILPAATAGTLDLHPDARLAAPGQPT